MSPTSKTIEKGSAVIEFKETPDQVAEEVDKLFTHEGYKIEKGDKHAGTYGKGSVIMQLLLGAFVKRFTFPFTISQNGVQAKLEIKNGTGGKLLGGAIGVSRHNKEFNRLVSLLTGETNE